MSEPTRRRQPKPRPAARPLTDEAGEVRELTLSDVRRMKPIGEAMPELVEAMADFRKKVGRPKAEQPKVHIGFRLSADLVERIRASGPGYNARVEEALRRGFMGRSSAGKVSKGGSTGKRRA
ncbi:MAG TPA: BrnA antitoxin family protein [Roseiarcus sp.]|nr:BrnA antitoxin family protein [Roseiarcus sp.]